ncbi:MAG: cupin domain-containing protein [Deltaproteobacteria bacterium]|jgi:quercetin dioxygenase-like cupin family protein|nr:cupin domain-containing protein [Deltaproteobacteria bacterium]
MEVASRIFSIEKFIRPSDGKPIRSEVLVTEESVVVVWHVRPGQEIAAHVHPHGQDTWTVISGTAEYYQGDGVVARLKAGEIAVAKSGQVHGAMNSGSEPFIFISVVAPGNAGYALAEK